MTMSDPSSGRDPVEELAEEFAARYRRGEHPSMTEYTDKYPELAAQIRKLFPALVVMEQLGSVAGPPTGPFDLERWVVPDDYPDPVRRA
jgi:eukaryotic-like serine/threonine-protein kinase